MATVGDRLRREREARNVSLDEMAESTGIGRSYLEALERDEIRDLPGRAFGKLYIRAYAEVLGFEPQPWIDDYDRERRLDPAGATEPTAADPVRTRAVAAAIAQWRESKMRGRTRPEDEPGVVSESEPGLAGAPHPAPMEARSEAPLDAPSPEPASTAPRTFRRPLVAAVVSGLLAVSAVTYFLFLKGGDETAPPLQPGAQALATPAPRTPPPATPPPATPPPATKPPARGVREAAPPAKSIAGPPTVGRLTVSEFGVGRRVVNLRLEGENDRFAPFDRVCFSTRVLGGRRGDVIRHVWIHEGRTEQTISLAVGGSDFRTHSNKTLGHTGSWAVEARDAKGTVLARATFSCTPDGH